MDEVILTDREADIMLVLWDNGPATVTEVKGQLSDDLAYTTVLTILRTLEAKGYVEHEEVGRAHRYSATVTEASAQLSALKGLSQKLFRGSAELLVSKLVSSERLSDGEIRRIRALLDRHKKGR